jgi:hypothetical protein
MMAVRGTASRACGRSKKQVPQVSHIRRLTGGGEAVCKCMDRSAVAAILIRHRAAKKVVAKSAVGHRRDPVHLLLLAEPSPPARTEPLAERLLTAQHVGVAPSIVNNNPETMERGRRSFPAAAGWFFARPAVAHECCVATLSCPGRSAARSGALQTRDRSSL